MDPHDQSLDAGMIVAFAAVLALWAAWPPGPLWTLLVLAPAAEEIVFRAGLQERLLRAGLPAHAANAMATFAFVLAHALFRSWPLALAVSLPSLALGALYQWRRRVGPCIAVHAAFNAFWIGINRFAPDAIALPSLLG
jgi:membrane protease YdiL (CAAX protease family)